MLHKCCYHSNTFDNQLIMIISCSIHVAIIIHYCMQSACSNISIHFKVKKIMLFLVSKATNTLVYLYFCSSLSRQPYLILTI